MLSKAVAVLVLVLVLSLAPGAHASTILNDGFESSGFADWVVDPAASGSLLFEGGNGHTGQAAAWFGALGAAADSLSISFATTPGDSYTFDFWLGHRGTDAANVFTVLWDGLPVLHLVNAGAFGYTEYAFVEPAAGTTSTISFSGRDMLSFFQLDDVSVSDIPAQTPEPSTMLLFGTGIFGLLSSRFRSRRSGRPHVGVSFQKATQ